MRDEGACGRKREGGHGKGGSRGRGREGVGQGDEELQQIVEVRGVVGRGRGGAKRGKGEGGALGEGVGGMRNCSKWWR